MPFKSEAEEDNAPGKEYGKELRIVFRPCFSGVVFPDTPEVSACRQEYRQDECEGHVKEIKFYAFSQQCAYERGDRYGGQYMGDDGGHEGE